MDSGFLLDIGIAAPMILLALSVHECAHAWTAMKLGDPTAYEMGRVTLNPLAHLDLWGTIAFVVCRFGWGKPVPYDRGMLFAANPRHGRWAELAVAAAGPLSNLILAGILRVAFLLLPVFPPAMGQVLYSMLFYGVAINAALFVFNLIPVFPLDGFTVLRNALPLDAALRFESTRAYGSYILLGLILLSRTGTFPFVGEASGLLIRHLYRLPA